MYNCHCYFWHKFLQLLQWGCCGCFQVIYTKGKCQMPFTELGPPKTGAGAPRPLDGPKVWSCRSWHQKGNQTWRGGYNQQITYGLLMVTTIGDNTQETGFLMIMMMMVSLMIILLKIMIMIDDWPICNYWAATGGLLGDGTRTNPSTHLLTARWLSSPINHSWALLTPGWLTATKLGLIHRIPTKVTKLLAVGI